MRHLLQLLVLILPLAVAPLAAAAGEPFRLVGAGEVSSLLGRPGVHVFDANTREVFARGHLPGARFVSFNDYPASALPADHHATLIFYCKNPH